MFHRFKPPKYDGGLREGEDYLNNADGETLPAPTSEKLTTGPNKGTYFFGQGEQFTIAALNRGLAALGENTDILDDRVTSAEALLQELDARVQSLAEDVLGVAEAPLESVEDRLRILTGSGTLHDEKRDGTVILRKGEPNMVLTLPPAATCAGWKTFIVADGLEHKAKIQANGQEHVNGAPFVELSMPRGKWYIISEGGGWLLV